MCLQHIEYDMDLLRGSTIHCSPLDKASDCCEPRARVGGSVDSLYVKEVVYLLVFPSL